MSLGILKFHTKPDQRRQCCRSGLDTLRRLWTVAKPSAFNFNRTTSEQHGKELHVRSMQSEAQRLACNHNLKGPATSLLVLQNYQITASIRLAKVDTPIVQLCTWTQSIPKRSGVR